MSRVLIACPIPHTYRLLRAAFPLCSIIYIEYIFQTHISTDLPFSYSNISQYNYGRLFITPGIGLFNRTLRKQRTTHINQSIAHSKGLHKRVNNIYEITYDKKACCTCMQSDNERPDETWGSGQCFAGLQCRCTALTNFMKTFGCELATNGKNWEWQRCFFVDWTSY